ncbi:MAG TPA: orotate phosphoribosyltransferase [Elusimicrobiales bacterium]|nr:orotate phosphoribosyltransferase [Elusimicrobiales bacterium]HOL63094.1 orotate phosphoribosyltransferase [Elusimicrobiales bacterium]HPO95893.1 orotate phosphoribosyltransferase [Elusimicrobiales bacterium]
MEEKEIKDILLKTGSLLTGHFKLSSGLHSDTYVQCALCLKYPAYASIFAKELYIKTLNLKPDIIISPALGGIIIGWEVARSFNLPFVFTEREEGVVKLRRGFNIDKYQKVLIVEDVFTTGKSTLEVADVVKRNEGIVVGACSIIKRGEFKFDFPSISLLNLDLKTYRPEACPMCEKNIPVIKPGSRK